MVIKMESTEKIVKINGVKVRLWEGFTGRGIKCKVFVHRIAVHNDDNQSEFETELREELQPGITFDLRHII